MSFRPKPKKAFSLLETVISTVLVSTLLVVSMSTLANVVYVRNVDNYVLQANSLARSLLAEASSKCFVDPEDASSNLGTNSGEAGLTRQNWNDFDDYHGLNMNTIVDAEGNTIADTAGWSANASVAYTDPNNTNISTGTESDLKKLTLTLTAPNGISHTFQALRSRFGLLQAGQSSDLLSQAEIHATLGGRNWHAISRIRNQQAAP